jgi:hypothetical protein
MVKTVFTREELYDLVWTEPMTTIAARYGISSVAMAKRCKRLGVPVPERGYWARKVVGRARPRPPLPAAGAGIQTRMHITKQRRSPEEENWSKAKAAVREAVKIEVTTAVVDEADLHPLVRRTATALRGATPDGRGILRPLSGRCLNIRTSPGSVDRALRIMDAVLRAAADRGFKSSTSAVPAPDDRRGFSSVAWPTTAIEVKGEEIPIELSEKVERVPHQVTPEEKAARRHNAHPPGSLKFRYASLFRQADEPKFDFRPTGVLLLQLHTAVLGARKRWMDTPNRTIEAVLGEVIAALPVIADAQIGEREAQHRRELERAKAERRCLEARRHEEIEQNQRETVDRDAKYWARSQRILSYVQAAETEALRRGVTGAERANFNEWAAWARDYANWLNPLTDEPAPWAEAAGQSLQDTEGDG